MSDAVSSAVYEYGKPDWTTFAEGASKEWLLTNGIGGFASSTITGANTRRYHGLLVASLEPPARRHLVLSKLDESIVIKHSDGSVSRKSIYSGCTGGTEIHGFNYLQRFSAYPLPKYTFNAGGVVVEKTVCLVYGENTCVVVYRITNTQEAFEFRIAPLVNFRDYHHIMRKGHVSFSQETVSGSDAGSSVVLKPSYMDIDIRLFCSDAAYVPSVSGDDWFTGMHYPAEAERGLDSVEDHYVPGYFSVVINEGETAVVTFVATIEKEAAAYDGPALQNAEAERIMRLSQGSSGDKHTGMDWFVESLRRAADAFLVKRASTGSMTILAGYPWFMDWGRDAMIALPGLTLATGRFDVAKDVLLTFSGHMKEGLIPNLFPDDAGEPAYNTADASLWFVEAAGRYAICTGDYGFIREHLYSRIKEVIENYAIGTDFNIGMDYEGLIEAGDENTQITWMDANVSGSAVTPRHGKPVELSALWYNALKTAADFAQKFDDGVTADLYGNIAARVREAFARRFWNEKGQCLYDVINTGRKDDSIRPNQILAVSLTHPVLEGDMAKKVLMKVYGELYQTYGLRTLSPASAKYAGVYTGSPEDRDRAYHNGTAWAWLIGHFITAWAKVFGEGPETSRMILIFIRPFMDHIKDAGIGYISEIFDGDPPNEPKGCIAQAWSVAELLRVCTEHDFL